MNGLLSVSRGAEARSVSVRPVLVALFGALVAVPALADSQALAEAGKKLAFDRSQGNCLACHYIANAESPGTIAPPLVAMQTRYPDKAKLREQIWDPTVANPESSMPPFGKHGILNDQEMDQVTEFVWGL